MNNANPLIFEIQETIQNIADSLEVTIPTSGACPKSLEEVLEEIQLIENNLIAVSSKLFSRKSLENVLIKSNISKGDNLQHKVSLNN